MTIIMFIAPSTRTQTRQGTTLHDETEISMQDETGLNYFQLGQ